MNESKISVRYAKALFLSAREQAIANIVRADAEMLLQTLAQSPELKDLVHSPVVFPSVKVAVFRALIQKIVHKVSLSFVELMITHKREGMLDLALRDYIELYKQDMGIRSAHITTATQMPVELRERLKLFVQKKFNAQVEISEQVDPSIIGGIILRVDDLQIDSSVSAQLSQYRRLFVN